MTDTRPHPGPSLPTSPEAAGQPVPDPRRWLTLAIVMVAGFMGLLDTTIVNVAIPTIRNDLNATFAEIEWVVAGYTLAYGLVLITGGRLGDLYGRKRLFMLGVAGFTIASAACGLAGSATVLVAFRAVQGAMAALMFPQVLSVVQVSFARHERARALGALGATIALSTVTGPLIGGLIIGTDTTGNAWRFIFLVNVPIGTAAFAAAAALMRESRAPRAAQLDFLGAAIATVALFLLVFPLVEGRDVSWAPWTFASMAASVPVFAAFAFLQWARDRRGRTPLVSLELFRNRGFSAGSLIGLVFFGGVPAYAFTFSIMLQSGLGFTALHAGLTMLPFSVGTAVGSGLSIRLSRTLGRNILILGAGLIGAAMLAVIAVLYRTGSDVTSAELIVPLVAGGLGMGCVVAPLANVVLETVDANSAGSASGVLTTVMQFGGALGVAVMGVLFFGLLASEAPAAAAAATPSLRASLTAAQPNAQPAVVAAQTRVFARCFAERANAVDPAASLPGCPAPGADAGPSAVAGALAAAAEHARADTFTRTERVALFLNAGLFALAALLVLVLPSRRAATAAGDSSADGRLDAA